MTGPKSCDQSLVTTTQEPETQFGKNNHVNNFSNLIHLYWKKYSSTCTFAMYITKKSRRLQKILLDFFVIYIAKAINSSDRMNYTFGVKT